MTVLEQRFLERVPILLNELLDETKKLRKETEELRERLDALIELKTME